MNSLNVLNRPLPWSSLGEQFLRFRKITSRNLTAFFSFLIRFFLGVFEIFLLRSIKANLCPNTCIINFDIVDFSERRPEEVISFF